jgi:hypothetical protein
MCARRINEDIPFRGSDLNSRMSRRTEKRFKVNPSVNLNLEESHTKKQWGDMKGWPQAGRSA